MWPLVGLAMALVAVVLLVGAWRADAAPGDSDSTFVPIAPCRLTDTRPGPSQIGAGSTFGTDETQTFVARGGNGECVIPTNAVGLSLNVTALRATLPTFVTVWPGGDRPNASSLNPSPGQPPTPNAVTTPLNAAGAFQVYNLQGRVDVIIDVNGYYITSSLQELSQRVAELEAETSDLDDLAAQLASLQSDLEALQDQVDASEPAAVDARLAVVEDRTASMSTGILDGQPTVRFTGVNVQLVDGSGDTTGVTNGRGNLIIGYNEDAGEDELRGGSHNIVVGTEHTYTSYAGVVFGSDNNLKGGYSSITGGRNNTVNGPVASVVGGRDNTVTGFYGSVLGGSGNTASGNRSVVTGGEGNVASETHSSVTGGAFNTASGERSTVSGGVSRSVSGGADWRAGDLFEPN